MLILRVQGVNALPDAGRGVAAFHRDLAHERVRKRMQHDVPDASKARVRVLDLARPSPLPMSLGESGLQISDLLGPIIDYFLPKLDEDAFPSDLADRNPERRVARE